jgi:hypothetical protein
MVYVSDWERLSDSLARVTTTGAGENEAQFDLCRAIAERKIKIRGHVEKDLIKVFRFLTDNSEPSWAEAAGEVREGVAMEIPGNLQPWDFDWQQSRPLNPWRARGNSIWTWEFAWIELSKDDVTRVLCRGGSGDGSSARNDRQEYAHRSRGKTAPWREKARQALKEIYPNGVPEQPDETNAVLCGKVQDWLKQNKRPKISDDTILRAAMRRK